MAEDNKTEAFLSRWSRLKQEQDQLPGKRPEQETEAPALPPTDQLTLQSDFSGFMHPKVEDALRRAALKTLFSDPHFKLADPFEPYSGDWTVGEPIPQAMLDSLEQVKTMLRKPPEPAAQAPAAETKEKETNPDEPGRQDA
jgi:hypothetical protein